LPFKLAFKSYARERERRHRDPTFARFLDVFHHRILSLFYRAWRETNQAASHDRPGEDAIAGYLASLIGIGMRSLRDRDSVPDDAKIHFAGRLVTEPRNPEGLEDILSGDLGVPARVEEFTGDWTTIPARYRCRLGADEETASLGRNTHVGSRFWDAQQRFRVVLGPMPLARFRRLLPPPPDAERHGDLGRSDWFRVRDWIRTYVGFEMAWDARLILAEVPELRLGHPDARLGHLTWLRVGSRAFPRLAADLILDGERKDSSHVGYST
jgi:type VI secretion system protein ImpH